MARGRKPAITGLPSGIGDQTARKLVKALGGGAGKQMKSKAHRIVKKLEKKDPVRASNIRGKSSKLEGHLAKSKVKRREMEKTSRMADAHMKRMHAEGRNWDGSPKK